MKWTSGEVKCFLFPCASQAAWLQGRASSYPSDAAEINTFLMGGKSGNVGGVEDSH